MSSDAQRFAARVIAAFQAAGHFTDQEVGDAGGPSTTTMTKLRKVASGEESMKPPRNDTFRKIDTAAAWPRGSARVLWVTGVDPDDLPEDSNVRRLYDGSPPAPGVAGKRRDPSVPPIAEDWGDVIERRLAAAERRIAWLESVIDVHDESVAADEDSTMTVDDESGALGDDAT